MTPRNGPQRGLTPEGYARELHHHLQIKSFPVDLDTICSRLGIKIKESDLGHGVDGCLIRTGTKSGILVNSNIGYEPRKRFTIAHELGHHQIPWHDAEQYLSSSKAIEEYYSDDQHEREANLFASEFLFPEAEAKKILKLKQVSLPLAMELADRFGMSLTAVALKLVRISMDRCAMFYSVNGKILWSVPSQSLRNQYELRSGSLSSDTYAADFFSGQRIPNQTKPVAPSAWLSSGYAELREVLEHSIPLPHLHAVISLVTLADQDDDEGELQEDW